MDDEGLLRACIDLARRGMEDGVGGPFGAVMACNGQLIAEGRNLVTSTHDPTAHAEVVAIRRACELRRSHVLADCEIFCSCEPCPMCLGAIYWSRIGRVVFAASQEDAAAIGFDDARLYAELRLPPDARTLRTEQMLRSDAARMMSDWRQVPKDRHY